MTTTRIQALAAVALLLGAVSHAGAQARWKEIGKTSTGNAVSIDPRSVKHAGGIVSATVRLVYTTPVSTPDGPLASTITKAMFNCAKRSMAVTESVMYGDTRGRKVLERHVNRIPGYGTTIKGSPTDVALGFLCKG